MGPAPCRRRETCPQAPGVLVSVFLGATLGASVKWAQKMRLRLARVPCRKLEIFWERGPEADTNRAPPPHTEEWNTFKGPLSTEAI